MYGSLDISTSGLIAQRTRLDIVAANVANARSILNPQGEYDPYRRRFAVFGSGDPASGSPDGVHVADIGVDQGPLRPVHQPGSPYADEEGYVYYPNVEPVIEQMNAMEAACAYEANITALEATKSMFSVALQIIA